MTDAATRAADLAHAALRSDRTPVLVSAIPGDLTLDDVRAGIEACGRLETPFRPTHLVLSPIALRALATGHGYLEYQVVVTLVPSDKVVLLDVGSGRALIVDS